MLAHARVVEEPVMRGSAEVIVNKGLLDVWEFVSDVKNMEEWVEGVSGPELTSDGDVGVGATFKSKYRYRRRTFDVEYEVTEYEPPGRFGTRSANGPFAYEALVELETYAGCTTVRHTVDAGPDSLLTRIIFLVSGPLVRGAMNRCLQKDLDKLKAAMESA